MAIFPFWVGERGAEASDGAEKKFSHQPHVYRISHAKNQMNISINELRSISGASFVMKCHFGSPLPYFSDFDSNSLCL